MFVRTEPREMPARYVKPGDEVATIGETPNAGVLSFARSEDFVRENARIVWWLVVDGAHLVPPPADPEYRRVEGSVRHSLDGQFSIEPMARGFVPDDVDHIGSHAIVIVPLKYNDGVGGPLRAIWPKEAEQFVIRERVHVDPFEYVENVIGSLTVTAISCLKCGGDHHEDNHDEVMAEGQRVSVGVTAEDEDAPGIALPIGPGMSGPGGLHPGEITAQLPSRRVPFGVLGVSYGRDVQESDAVNFRSERDSDEGGNA